MPPQQMPVKRYTSVELADALARLLNGDSSDLHVATFRSEPEIRSQTVGRSGSSSFPALGSDLGQELVPTPPQDAGDDR
jgi:hypothetical protein